jgi:hypothetical protein
MLFEGKREPSNEHWNKQIGYDGLGSFVEL